MKQFDDDINELYQENMNSIKVTRRQLYPRNFELSQEFVDAFKLEYKRLLEGGQRPKALMEKISKALNFHI